MIGKTISHYKILEKLGEGGMGVVYKAEDTKLKRTIALKFLPQDLTRDEDAKSRFMHEAQAASALDHPNICTIYEIDETKPASGEPAEGQMFIAMAYYGGETLKEKIERGPLPVDEAIDITRQIAEGLARAHESDIIHRDIKPANILITERGEVKIVDFGLAKLSGRTQLTKEGTTIGTISYMSPEQTQGAEVDHRTDIWALGVIFYEMITGKQPFRGDYEQAVMYSILHEEPEPMATLSSEAPVELTRMVDQCLQKEPSARYQQVDQLTVDLRQLGAESAGTGKTAFRFRSSKQKILWTGFVMIIATALVFVFGSFFFSGDEQTRERIAILVADVVNETGESELDGLSELLITSLEQSRRLSPFSRSRIYDVLREMGKTDVERIDESLGREICKKADIPVLAIANVRKFGQLYTIDLKLLEPESGEYLLTAREEGDGLESVLAMIDNLSETTRRGLDEREEEIQLTNRKVAEVTTVNLKAYEHYFRGRAYTAQFEHQKADAEYEQAILLDPTFALAQYRLARSRGFSNAENPSPAEIRKILPLINRLPEKEQQLLLAYNAAADYSEKGLQEGLAILKKAEKIYPNDKDILLPIGDFSTHLGAFADDYYRDAIEYLGKVLALEPTHYLALSHLAWAHGALGQDKQAIAYRQKLLALYRRVGEYRSLAGAYLGASDLASALRTYEEGLSLYPDNPSLLVDVGNTYAYMGHYQKAEEQFKAMIEVGQPDAARKAGLEWLARFYPYLGKYSQMKNTFEELIELAWSERDTNEVVLRTLGKIWRMGWGRDNSEEIHAEVMKVEPLMNERLRPFDLMNFGLSFVYFQLGDLEKARYFRQKLRGSTWQAYLEARMYQAQQEWDLAISLFERHSRIFGFFKALDSYHVAQCYYEMGELDRAIAEVKRVQTLYSNSRAYYYPMSFLLLGKIYEKKGDAQLAIENYEKFLDLWKDADEDLPDLIEAKTRLAKLRTVSSN